MRFLLCRTGSLSAFVAASCFFLAAQAIGQETLRWKLQEGQQFDVVMNTEVNSQQTVMGEEITTDMEMVLNFGWTVDNVGEEEVISLTQSIERMRMNMTVPVVGEVVVDTDAEEDTGPIARQVGAVIRPFIGIDFHLEMSDLGEILDATLSEEDIEALAAGGGAFEMFTKDSFEQMLHQSGIVFPEEAVSPGDTWSGEWEVDSPIGTMLVEAEYTIVEFVEQEGVRCAKIEMSATSAIREPDEENGTGINIEIKDQEIEGVILFAIEEGRILESQTEQTLSMEVTVGSEVVPQKVATTSQMTITPREE